MKPYWKKSLAFLLALAMCLSLLPAAHVHAAGGRPAAERQQGGGQFQL